MVIRMVKSVGFIQFHENHPFTGRIIEMVTSLEALCIRIMTYPQVIKKKFAPILTSKTHLFWPHIPSTTQNGSAPPGRAPYFQKNRYILSL